jgi:hypothetical protein
VTADAFQVIHIIMSPDDLPQIMTMCITDHDAAESAQIIMMPGPMPMMCGNRTVTPLDCRMPRTRIYRRVVVGDELEGL